MLEFEREKFESFLNMNFDEILENFEQNADISDDNNYWFFDNEKQEVLFISYFEPNKSADINIIHKEEDLMIEQNKISISLKASLYAGILMYEQGFPLLLLNANSKNNFKKANTNVYDTKTALDIFIDDNPDFDLDETKLIIFLFNEGRDYFSTTVQLPSKYKSIMKELKLKERLLDNSDFDYLSEQYRVPSINLAIGFYDFGKSSEKLNYLDLEDSIKIALSITELLETVDKENLQFEMNESDDEEFEEEETDDFDDTQDDDEYEEDEDENEDEEEEDDDDDYYDEDYDDEDDDY